MNIAEAVSASESNEIERSKYSYRQLGQLLPILDNHEPMVPVIETKRVSVQPFWEMPGDLEGDLYQSYISENPGFQLVLRKQVAIRLTNATEHLPAGWKLVIKAGYRPLTVQYDVLREVGRQIKLKKPTLTEAEALKHARMFVTDPAIMCPPHCTGAAVDVDVVDAHSGKVIDMGCPPNTDEEIAFTHYTGLSSRQQNNRMQLLNAMFAAGFANLAHEWWHFSYGDQYWAAFYNQPCAIYNIC